MSDVKPLNERAASRHRNTVYPVAAMLDKTMPKGCGYILILFDGELVVNPETTFVASCERPEALSRMKALCNKLDS